MDRTDELRNRPDDVRDESHRDEARRDQDRHDEEAARDEVGRPGGVLGIADADPPRDPVPSDGRGVKGVEIPTDRPGSREVQRSPGATGIDMGAGGEGTDIAQD